MTMNTKERLKEYIKFKGMAVTSFEKSIGAANSYVNSIYKSIGPDKVNVIIEKYPDLNMDWLLTNRGEMLTTKQEMVIETKEKPSYISADGYQFKYISLLEKSIASLERTVASLEAKIAELTKES
jgi:hypothetical protein